MSLTRDFTHLRSASAEEPQAQLRALADRGQTLAAIYVVRQLHGCSLAEAKDMVEALGRGHPDPDLERRKRHPASVTAPANACSTITPHGPHPRRASREIATTLKSVV